MKSCRRHDIINEIQFWRKDHVPFLRVGSRYGRRRQQRVHDSHVRRSDRGGIIGDIVSIKDDSIVIETTTDRVRVEFAKFAVSTNNTAEKEAAKQKAAALAARKAEKEKAKKEK